MQNLYLFKFHTPFINCMEIKIKYRKIKNFNVLTFSYDCKAISFSNMAIRATCTMSDAELPGRAHGQRRHV